jgi:cytochrome c1
MKLDNLFTNFNKTILIIFFSLFSVLFIEDLSAAEGAPCKDYGECDDFKHSLTDLASLQRGVSTYLTYCYGCHSLEYSRWNRVAADLDIPEKIFFNNLVFDSSVKPGDLMAGSMSKEESAVWFGVAPPDLTLVTRLHGSDWVYTYLRTFYEDSSKQYGVNNLVYPGAAMPNVLASLQGNQQLTCKQIPVIANNGGEKRDDLGNTITKEKCGFLKVEAGTGALNKEEFDNLIYDLTNFLTYVGDPDKVERERIGWYVVFFFIIFTTLASLLYREYQKDYH